MGIVIPPGYLGTVGAWKIHCGGKCNIASGLVTQTDTDSQDSKGQATVARVASYY